MKPRVASPVRALPALVLLAGVTLMTATGCSESGDPVSANEPTGQVETDPVPEMSELESEAALTPQQVAELAPALGQWRRAVAASEAAEDILLEDAPAVAFLGAASSVVAPNQFGQVMNLARRAIGLQGDNLAPDPGDRQANRHRGIRGLFRDLDLTEDQIAAIRDAMAAAREDALALCDQYNDGDLTEEELRAARQELREDLMDTIKSLLTDKQLEILEATETEIVVRRLTRMLTNFETRVEKRVEHLDALLELDDAQETAITNIILATKPELEALLSDVESGAVSANQALEDFVALRMETRDAVRGELTEEQIQILDDLRDMHQPCVTNAAVVNG